VCLSAQHDPLGGSEDIEHGPPTTRKIGGVNATIIGDVVDAVAELIRVASDRAVVGSFDLDPRQVMRAPNPHGPAEIGQHPEGTRLPNKRVHRQRRPSLL
jgi:hypothetical protein